MNTANIKQSLIETIADWLDSETVTFEQDCQKISEGVQRERSVLHIDMAEAAMKVYLEKCTRKMNYTVTLIDSPVGFEIRDEKGNLIAFVIDESTANVFAHVPELLEMLDACLDTKRPFTFSDARELQKKLKPFRP